MRTESGRTLQGFFSFSNFISKNLLKQKVKEPEEFFFLKTDSCHILLFLDILGDIRGTFGGRKLSVSEGRGRDKISL